MLIDGIHIPLTVPFTRDGESYLRKLEYNVGRYSLTPAAGLVAAAATLVASLASSAALELARRLLRRLRLRASMRYCWQRRRSGLG